MVKHCADNGLIPMSLGTSILNAMDEYAKLYHTTHLENLKQPRVSKEMVRDMAKKMHTHSFPILPFTTKDEHDAYLLGLEDALTETLTPQPKGVDEDVNYVIEFIEWIRREFNIEPRHMEHFANGYMNSMNVLETLSQTPSKAERECEHDYVYKILHNHKAADICTKCSHIKLQSTETEKEVCPKCNNSGLVPADVKGFETDCTCKHGEVWKNKAKFQ